ncbi:D-alanyl-D-alanine carboxypeptidase/D-alanyl-D-alanine-endopeptidase [Baekduia sp. Peel2402]|uniref:D-alanyl-D-alanine carboxypeptidase/D-alanyl-D-alanine-endopeptidase n=1 Tax=Baekduia sp. Peel2402 TaxID=3458296 RepID=UPI00403EAF51
MLQRFAIFTSVTVLTITALAAAPAAQAAHKPSSYAQLRAQLSRLARTAGGSGGYVVLDGTTGRTLASSDANTVRSLGSTAKLLTTGTAVDLLGVGGTLNTTLSTVAGVTPDGTLGGDLILHGGGDPLLDEAQLGKLADVVQARGIRTITGSIVGDESAFDTLRGGPATNGAFDPELTGVLGALTYARGRNTPNGQLLADPAAAAATRFDDVLENRGLKVRGTPRTGTTPPGAAELGGVATRLPDVVKVINKTSDDFAAEMLTKVLGGGTTAAGAARIAQHARQLGAVVNVVDGSGVDRRTKASPRQLARFVRAIRTRPAIAASLPIAAVDGTLRDRMIGGAAAAHCYAKTGTLPQSRVSALAGWCRTHGKTRVFVILREGVRSEGAAKASEDAMVQRIAATRSR